jgi:pyruvate/2-oxoglutarate dehydrogenase complex dihydrolipoamide acyltransferase (E2) component
MDVVMPQLGETVAEGKVSTWFKAPGDQVQAGENLFEIETDKVTMEVQALASGVLSEIRVQSGETAPVGTIVAVIGDAGANESAAMVNTPNDEGATSASPSPLQEAIRGGAASARPDFVIAPFAETQTPERNFGKAESNGLKVTPLARRLIVQNGIDIASLTARAKSRGAWRIGKADVLTALGERRAGLEYSSSQGGGAPAGRVAGVPDPAISGERLPFNNIRRQTAERLAQSWRTTPHVFQGVEVDFAAVDSVRQARKAEFKARSGVSLTYLPFITRALAIAIRDFPRVNARLEDDGLLLAPEINLGFAVDLAHEGLVVPVLRNADELTVAGLARAIGSLVERARGNALKADDFAGGTYTISNNGSFGTLFTAPIINPPQVAILSIDAVRKRPVVVETETGDAVAVHPVGILSQSFDHRAFDGAYSAAFLRRVKEVLETHDWNVELG